MKAFVTAAKEDIGEVNEEDLIRTTHDDEDVVFYRPQPSQLSLMMTMGRGKIDQAAIGTFLTLFFNMCEPKTRRYFEDRLMDPRDPFDIDGDGGILDMFKNLAEEWSGRPTEGRSASAKSRSATGKASTGSTRAKASTSSRSRSRATSQ